MHPLIELDGNDPAAVATARQAFADIIELEPALCLDGTIAAEHGVGTLKRAFIDRELGFGPAGGPTPGPGRSRSRWPVNPGKAL